jgi:anaerobic carbon-monoxide dehydrogenase iron sulfur subunit
MVKKRILINEEYCIGCRLCEVYCITQHSSSKNILKAYKGEYPRPASGIVFEERGYTSFALQCRHCDEPLCVEACLTGAMYLDEGTGYVLHNRDQCVGCWMCIMVCPFGVIKPDLEQGVVASKCDLCVEAEYPACVAHCPNGAIRLVEVNE